VTAPRIAVCQAPYLRDAEQATLRALDQLRQAASRGVDVVVFPEWVLGLNPVEVLPNRYTERIARLAQELHVMVVTGSIRVLDAETGKKQQRSLVFDRDGALVGSQAKVNFSPPERPWFEPGTGINAVLTRSGRIVILPGLDATDPVLWKATRELRPDLVVMAANPKTLNERSELQDLAVTRSLEIHGTVVLAPLCGRFSGATYVGGALIASEGRILGITDEPDTVLVAGDAESALIQLGVTDVSSYLPLARPLPGVSLDPKKAVTPEAEKRVLVDWGALAHHDIMENGLHLLAVSRENPRWTALAPARPHYAQELHQLLEHGAAGAFMYPGLDRLFPWHDAVRQLGSVLAPYRRPLLVHSGPGVAPLRYDAPALWDEFVAEFPMIPLILLHMGGRSPYVEEALVLAERHPSVWLETSRAPVGAIREAIRQLGTRRVVFGSGGTSALFSTEWAKVEILKDELTPEGFQQVVYHNARALFFPGERAPQRAGNESATIQRLS